MKINCRIPALAVCCIMGLFCSLLLGLLCPRKTYMLGDCCSLLNWLQKYVVSLWKLPTEVEVALERHYLKLCNEQVYGNGNIWFLGGFHLCYMSRKVTHTRIVSIIHGHNSTVHSITCVFLWMWHGQLVSWGHLCSLFLPKRITLMTYFSSLKNTIKLSCADQQTERSIQRVRREISRAAMMWFKVAVVVAAVLVQLSGNKSHIFNCNIPCRKGKSAMAVTNDDIMFPGRTRAQTCCHLPDRR